MLHCSDNTDNLFKCELLLLLEALKLAFCYEFQTRRVIEYEVVLIIIVIGLFSQQTFLTSYSRKSAAVTNNINGGSVLFKNPSKP